MTILYTHPVHISIVGSNALAYISGYSRLQLTVHLCDIVFDTPTHRHHKNRLRCIHHELCRRVLK